MARKLTLPIKKVLFEKTDEFILVSVDYRKTKDDTDIKEVEIWVQPEEVSEDQTEISIDSVLFGRKARRFLIDNTFVSIGMRFRKRHL